MLYSLPALTDYAEIVDFSSTRCTWFADPSLLNQLLIHIKCRRDVQMDDDYSFDHRIAHASMDLRKFSLRQNERCAGNSAGDDTATGPVRSF